MKITFDRPESTHSTIDSLSCEQLKPDFGCSAFCLHYHKVFANVFIFGGDKISGVVVLRAACIPIAYIRYCVAHIKHE